jgi:hypothetical protein
MADGGRRTVTERNLQKGAAVTSTSGVDSLLTLDCSMLLTVRRPLLTAHR